MLTDQHFYGLEGSLRDAKNQVPSRTSVEFGRSYDAQIHEIVDAITASVTGAQAGLIWLRVDPPDLEEVRRTLSAIVSDGKRAADLVIRLRALMKNVPTAAEDPDRR